MAQIHSSIYGSFPLSSLSSLLFSHFLFGIFSFALFTQSIKRKKPKTQKHTMLLGKRQRPSSINRTTSLSEIKLDLNLPSDQEPSDHHNMQDQIMTVDVHQRLLADDSEDFLRSCFLCKRHLVPSRDIYMYRGDKAFCSLECRQQQITVDEMEEKKKIPVKSTVVVAGATTEETVSATM